MNELGQFSIEENPFNLRLDEQLLKTALSVTDDAQNIPAVRLPPTLSSSLRDIQLLENSSQESYSGQLTADDSSTTLTEDDDGGNNRRTLTVENTEGPPTNICPECENLLIDAFEHCFARHVHYQFGMSALDLGQLGVKQSLGISADTEALITNARRDGSHSAVSRFQPVPDGLGGSNDTHITTPDLEVPGTTPGGTQASDTEMSPPVDLSHDSGREARPTAQLTSTFVIYQPHEIFSSEVHRHPSDFPVKKRIVRLNESPVGRTSVAGDDPAQPHQKDVSASNVNENIRLADDVQITPHLYPSYLAAARHHLSALQALLFSANVSLSRNVDAIRRLQWAVKVATRYEEAARLWTENGVEKLRKDLRYMKILSGEVAVWGWLSGEERKHIEATITTLLQDSVSLASVVATHRSTLASLESRLYETSLDTERLSRLSARLHLESSAGSSDLRELHAALQRSASSVARSVDRARTVLSERIDELHGLEFERDHVQIQMKTLEKEAADLEPVVVRLSAENSESFTQLQQATAALGIERATNARMRRENEDKHKEYELATRQLKTTLDDLTKRGEAVRHEATSVRKKVEEATIEGQKLKTAEREAAKLAKESTSKLEAAKIRHSKEVLELDERQKSLASEMDVAKAEEKKAKDRKEAALVRRQEYQMTLERERARADELTEEMRITRDESEEKVAEMKARRDAAVKRKAEEIEEKRRIVDEIAKTRELKRATEAEEKDVKAEMERYRKDAMLKLQNLGDKVDVNLYEAARLRSVHERLRNSAVTKETCLSHLRVCLAELVENHRVLHDTSQANSAMISIAQSNELLLSSQLVGLTATLDAAQTLHRGVTARLSDLKATLNTTIRDSATARRENSAMVEHLETKRDALIAKEIELIGANRALEEKVAVLEADLTAARTDRWRALETNVALRISRGAVMDAAARARERRVETEDESERVAMEALAPVDKAALEDFGVQIVALKARVDAWKAVRRAARGMVDRLEGVEKWEAELFKDEVVDMGERWT
ncbi:hypothetical protein HDU93_006034 [Gonapodya sp. JEL0774]|nr:hypothetical protein HDU93_006034 [Gonapodya sp. JEL0774]